MKKLLAILLVVAMLVFVGGCGSNTADSSSAPSKQSEKPVSSAKSEAPASSAEEEIPEEPWYTDTIVFTKADLDKAKSTTYVKPKNVIFMVGDGMGLNDIEICNRFSDFKFDFGLVLDQLPNQATAKTRSQDSSVTDSAASGTALATGVKTKNGYIGKDAKGEDLKNISEIARELNKKIGIVTSDSLMGATPTAFSVHNISRNNTAELARSLLEMKPDVAIGNGYSDFISAGYADDEHKAMMKEIALAPDFNTLSSMLKLEKYKTMPLFGFSGFELKSGDYRLAQATQIALRRLENENGFFLMVENAGTDKAGHSNDKQGKVDNVAIFDKAVAVAVKYCMEHPDTVLIITSDHETGGVELPETDDYTLDDIKFNTTNHSAVNVGIFALGYGTQYFNGQLVDNTDIAKFAISAIKGEL